MEKQFLFVHVANPTWLVYVALLLLTVFFRFTRFFSIRNLDLVLILALSSALVISGDWKLSEVTGGPALAGSTAAAAIQVVNLDSTTTETGVSSPAPQEAADDPSDSDPVLPNNASSGTAASAAIPKDTVDDVQPTSADQENQAGEHGNETSETVADRADYHWSTIVLLALSVLLMVRLVFDEALTRRPKLEQNLNQSGMMFLCLPAFGLLAVSVFVLDPPDGALRAMEHGRALLERREVGVEPVAGIEPPPAPTETLLAAGAAGVAQLSENLGPGGQPPSARAGTETMLARILVVISHFIVVSGLLYIGRLHFGSMQLGFSMSCLYLLLPCTSFHVHQLSHVLPAACLTWAFACYRKPALAGILLGLACGTLFFAVFLLPLWAVFYGRRGSIWFVSSLVGVALILIVSLMLTSADTNSFMSKIVTTTNWTVYRLLDDNSSLANPGFGQLLIRIPMAALFFVMLTAMTVLPRPRNLESLLANSTVLVVAAQLWYPEDIGMYVLWYLPLLLLVVFRPRLDRLAPPEILGRKSATVPVPSQQASASAVAMNRVPSGP
jgi:hypothetical protein